MQKSRLYMGLGGLCIALTAVVAWQLKPAQTPQIVAAGKLQCDLPAPDAKAPHPGMVWVPPGTFDMGDSVYAEEKPVRNVQVKGFWMDRTEVTNQEFAAFVKATDYVTVAERPVDPKLHDSLPEVMRQALATPRRACHKHRQAWAFSCRSHHLRRRIGLCQMERPYPAH
jgi:formylglycine-generating enzyme required for sulfatase activity